MVLFAECFTAFGEPHEMRWHSYVQYLNMPSINAWHLRHLPQAIKRFHCFIAVQYYHSRQHREWQIILICRKRYGTTDSPGPCPGLHPQIGMQHKNVLKHFYGILVSQSESSCFLHVRKNDTEIATAVRPSSDALRLSLIPGFHNWACAKEKVQGL